MIVYEIYRNRYKELFITAQSNGVPYQAAEGEKVNFIISDASGTAVLTKELTAGNYDETLKSYKLVLSSADTDIPEGRYYFECFFLDADEEKHQLSSGRIVVKRW